jgi:DNA-nicking Smr family endonuclease
MTSHAAVWAPSKISGQFEQAMQDRGIFCVRPAAASIIIAKILVKKRDETGATGEADAFARAMLDANVVPLRKSHGRVRATAPVSMPPRASITRDDEAEADGESYESFTAHGVDRREIQKLKRGEYVAAARYDLHGLTAQVASSAVNQFLDTSCRRGHRCVCIVHGRGLRSPGGVAVLKTLVRALLRSHRGVLAFADAPRSDGGSGAVYLLLRRRA